jgi:Uri superfamily endonuclease
MGSVAGEAGMKATTRIKKGIAYLKNAQSHIDYLNSLKKPSRKSLKFHIAQTQQQSKTAISFVRNAKSLPKESSKYLIDFRKQQDSLIRSIQKLQKRGIQ